MPIRVTLNNVLHTNYTEKHCTQKLCKSHVFPSWIQNNKWIFEYLEMDHCDRRCTRSPGYRFIVSFQVYFSPHHQLVICKHFLFHFIPPSANQVALISQGTAAKSPVKAPAANLGGRGAGVGGGAKPEVYTPEAGGALDSPRWSDPSRSV